MSENFNPKSPEYKKIEDLPEKEQNNFVNVEGGFVRKEAAKELSDAELSAEIANTLRKEGITSMDVLHKKAEEMEISMKDEIEKIKQGGYGLREDTSPELRSNKRFVLEAIENNRNGRALEFASPELKNDKEVVMKAIRQSGDALEFASPELRSDREFVLEAIKMENKNFYDDVRALEFVSPELKNDKELVLEAIEISRGRALEFASPRTKKGQRICNGSDREKHRPCSRVRFSRTSK